MVVTYDPLLVTLSIVIAILGSYTGLRLAQRLVAESGPVHKAYLSGAAVTIGGGIWSMHFVGMLAARMPMPITYDVLLTLNSALVAILVTGLGLFIASFGALTPRKLAAAGLLMGLGISTMHYVGMAAVRANVVMDYASVLVVLSVLIGIFASALALWLAFSRLGPWQTAAAAVVMALAISGMHYTAMAAMSLSPATIFVDYAAPALSPYLLAVVVAVTAFLIFGFTLLVALPDRPKSSEEPPAANRAEAVADKTSVAPVAAANYLIRLPVQKNKATLFLDLEDVVSIQAEAHYTRVYDGTETYFCSLSVSELEEKLDRAVFLRVHRSHIVNLHHAKSLERHNEQAVIRLDGATAPSVPVSRRNVSKLRMALGL
ncbi:MAG: MHYT domain-containing protein [Alphaproteobacteria bacterium]